MRSILVDWLIELSEDFNLRTETIFLTILILDKYLEKEKLQSETRDFTTKKNKAAKIVNELKIKSEDANAKLSSITSEIFKIKSFKLTEKYKSKTRLF